MKALKTLLVLFISSSTISVVSAAAPALQTSGASKCYYLIDGKTSSGAVYNSGWQETSCIGSVDFSSISGLGKIPDGTYYLKMKGFDNTALGTDKTYSDGTSASKTNKYGPTTFGPYKIDTTPPKCLLKEIRLKAGASNNQYFNNGNLYYKQAPDAKGQFELVIEADDSAMGTNTSGLQRVAFGTILGASPTTRSFPSETWTGNAVVAGLYSWEGNQSDSGNILNNKNFCFDFAGNGSPLVADANTKLIYEDGMQQVSVSSLTLTSDSSAPTVGGVALDNMTNGIKFKSGNNGDGSDFIVYDQNTSAVKFFSALDNRQIILPKFQDKGAGLRSFKVSIEKAEDKSSNVIYARNLSNKDSRITDLSDTVITHDFSRVRKVEDVVDGYRRYGWTINPLGINGANISGWDNTICDMVGNCVSVPTPDFRVVANGPVLAANTSLTDGSFGTHHNLNQSYAGNDSTMRSNFSDIHTSVVYFRDKYGNEIMPVSGVKDVNISINFDNTLGCDQLFGSEVGDCVDFTFRNGTTNMVGTTHSVSETKNFGFHLMKMADFLGDLTLELKSAVPTKGEYLSTAGANLYGSMTAILQMKNLKIETVDKLSYAGIGEKAALELANSSANQANYKWNPIINYNQIADIYPLVEGQEKNLPLANIVHDLGGLAGYRLQTHLGTNNLFLQLKDIYLAAGNIGTAKYKDNYMIFSGFPYSGQGIIGYSANDILKFTPKTLGGISSDNTNIAFYSTLHYGFGTKSVSLPSLQTGFGSYGVHESSDFIDNSKYYNKSLVTLAEVDVRGISQTRNKLADASVTTSGTGFVDISSINLFDFKTDIHKNVASLLAGVNTDSAIVSGGYTLSNLSTFPTNAGKNLKNGQILYFKNTDVTLDCSSACEVSGKKTLIIENGNLFIKSDMKYKDGKSILGIILLGNKSGDTSQVRISEKVTNGVGVVYAEGPVISVRNSDAEIYDGNNPSNTSLVNQLYWRGSLATRNTVGGSIKNGQGVCPFGTPDYKKSSCTIQKAQGYDLIYLRRYARIDKAMYSIAGDPMGDGKVPLNIDKVSVKTAGGDIYDQGTAIKTDGSLPKPTKENLNAPLIIEYDPSAQTNPPLGFVK